MFESVELCVEKLKKEFDVLSVIDCDNITVNDLYLKTKNLWQETFENNQRIVFTLTTDKHNDHSGIILHSIQTILNTVDISNFFACIVTTNPNINNEYKYLLDNISNDRVSIHVYLCPGEYTKAIATNYNEKPFEKYADITKNIIDTVGSMTETEKYLIFQSQNFCIMPWIGVNIEPDSRVRPCCESTQQVGDCSANSLEEIWNSDEFKKIRAEMSADQPVKTCENCYKKEKIGRDSMRLSVNRRFADKIQKLKQTRIDGYLEDFTLNYWDIRYNNLCNLACRSCGPNASSSWHQVNVALGKIKNLPKPILIAGSNKFNIFDQMMQHIDHVETIYFAGGEPLIIEEFYEILEVLLSKGRSNVHLLYNTNLTKTSLKKKKIFDLWKKFPNVSIGASIDGLGTRGEYLRQGLAWKEIVKNRKEMLRECPHIDFYISATVSILNVLHLPDFHRECVELGLIGPSDFNVQMLYSPRWLRTSQLPYSLKQQVIEKYNAHLQWLTPLDTLGRATYSFRGVLKHIEHTDVMDYENFWKNANDLDRYHNTDLLKVFPELSILKDKLL